MELLLMEELLRLDETGLDPRGRIDRKLIRYSIRNLDDGKKFYVLRNSQCFRVQSIAAKEMFMRNMRRELKYCFENGGERLRKIVTPYIMHWNRDKI